MPTTDIIAAIATPIGRGGIGVVRISGTDLKPLSLAMLGRILYKGTLPYVHSKTMMG